MLATVLRAPQYVFILLVTGLILKTLLKDAVSLYDKHWSDRLDRAVKNL